MKSKQKKTKQKKQVKSKKANFDLTLLVGKKGTGKTTLLTKLALQYSKKGWIVYSNVKLPNSILFNPNDLLTKITPQPYSLFLFDEGGLVFNNRDFKSFPKNLLFFFKMQRHYKCKVFIASQSLDIDKKVRDLLDYIWYMKRFFHLVVYRPLTTYLYVDDTPQNSDNICFAYKFMSIFTTRFLFAPKWWKYFNSFSLELLGNNSDF